MSATWRLYGLVGLGGAIGGLLRFLVSHFCMAGDLPWATLLANVLGSFLIGLYVGLPTQWRWTSGSTHVFVTAGLLGGFTTFSVFSLEVLTFLQQQQWLSALSYWLLSISLWLAAVTAGYRIAKLAPHRQI